ncbi:MAG TPA: ABC transporter substrate-binding protein [Thermomicrobiales bacterium]|nr:ABC transporter substrate-binding protein [Thermomicrobiales bacterium]
MALGDIDVRARTLGKTVSRRMFLRASAGVFGLTLLAACGGDDDPPAAPAATTAPDATAAPADATEAPMEATPTAAGDAVRGVEIPQFDNPAPGEKQGSQPEELVMAWGTSQFAGHGIDPQRHVGTIAETQLRHMYEPLVKFERDLQTISPALATAWERIDDLTVQFTLREGVTFHNGEEFNAEAVRYSILRPLSDETPGDTRSTYAIISDVVVVDDYTVNVVTSSPDPALLARMTGFHTTIVAPEWAAQGPETVASEANGTGPYKLVSWSPNEDLVLESNEDYWGGAPSIKKVRLKTIVEQATRVAALRSGEVHVAKDMPPEEIQGINDSGRARVVRAVSNRVPFYFMTVEIEPFDDPRVRQAINYAANVAGVIDAIVLGNANRVSTVLGPWIFGFDPDLEPYPHDPDRARELLAEAGYPDGIDIQIWHIQGRYPKDKEVAEAMAQEMAAAGIRCTPELREAATLTELQIAKETPGLIFASWGNWFFDADNTFVPLFGCQQAAAFNDWRRPYGCNQELEDLLQAARIELDVATRLDLYKQAQRVFYDDAGALFMYQLVDIFGVDNWVSWEPRHEEMMWAHDMEWNI